MQQTSLSFRRRAPPSSGPAVSDASGDVALLERIRERDMRAFEELFRRYHPRLTRFLLNILRHPHLAEEALNDTLMVVWKKPESYNGASKVSTWIFAIAYRIALKARSRHKEPVSDEHAVSQPSGDMGADEQIGRRQTQEILMDAIGRLSADHRAVIDLTYFHHMGCGEIAEILRCPVGTVKTRMHHARKHMKTMLAGQLSDWL